MAPQFSDQAEGGINCQRPAVELWYETGDTEPGTPVTVRAVNAENGDVGIKHDLSDGLVTFTYPAGTNLVDHVVVTRDDTGEAIAEFDVAVRIAE